MQAGLRARRPALEKDSAIASQPSGPPPTPMSEVGGLPGVLQDRQPAEALLRPGGAVTRCDWMRVEWLMALHGLSRCAVGLHASAWAASV